MMKKPELDKITENKFSLDLDQISPTLILTDRHESTLKTKIRNFQKKKGELKKEIDSLCHPY